LSYAAPQYYMYYVQIKMKSVNLQVTLLTSAKKCGNAIPTPLVTPGNWLDITHP